MLLLLIITKQDKVLASDGQDSPVAPLNSLGPGLEGKSGESAIPAEQTRTENSDKPGGQNVIVNSSGGPGDAAEVTASNNALEAILTGKGKRCNVRRGMILPQRQEKCCGMRTLSVHLGTRVSCYREFWKSPYIIYL